MTSRTVSRLGAATGLAYVVLVLLGNDVLAGAGGPDFTAPATKVAAHLAANPPTTVTYVGGFVELIGLLCFVAFVAKLFCVVRRAEGGDGFLAVTALSAGLLSAAIKFASGPAALEAFNRAREGLDPQLAAALIDMNGFAFLLTFALDALMLAAVAAVALRTGVLPRWQGIMAAVTAALLLLTVAGAGTVPPLGMLLALVWIAAVSVTLVRRVGASDAAPVGAEVSAGLA
jgi:hypothetical protein